MKYYSMLKLFLAIVLVMFTSTDIWALPQGGTVTAGGATINQSGSDLGISQTSSKAIINWNSFSIASGESVNFSQPSASAIALNRVIGIDPSLLNGVLGANGRVFLLNPNGILIGSGASINVSGLLASTMNISDQDFLNDNYNFTQTSTIGSVINNGTITGSEVVLAAPTVENNGLISASLGKVYLASGDSLVLNFTGNELIGFNVSGSNAADTITNSGTITADGGEVYISAAIAQDAVKSVVNNTGVIEANSISNVGGVIRLSSRVLYQTGTISADGASGGSVDINTDYMLQGGAVTANGTSGSGGSVVINAASALIQTASAVTSANGAVNGGTVSISTPLGNLFSSGTITASGGSGTGGTVKLLGQSIALVAATVDASGDAGGGIILIGGDYQGSNPLVQNAQSAIVNPYTIISTDARVSGDGGKVIVWSDALTEFSGNISARGGSVSGNGGFVEVSSKQDLSYAGIVDAGAANGTAGTLLLDPANIVISAAGVSFGSYEIIDPHPTTGGMFGSWTVALSNGNVVVTAPGDDLGAGNAGAVYLFNQATGALISSLVGSTLNDAIGNGGVFVLVNGNYVVTSPYWDNGAIADVGAVTWCSGTTGCTGAVSTVNSLHGSTVMDNVGSGGVTALKNGNYVVRSQFWDNGALPLVGAVTWCDGAIGCTGAVSTANSLYGSAAYDTVGSSGVTALINGNYVVSIPSWDNGAIVDAGAVTWCDGTTGCTGAVSTANSLYGSTFNDQVGFGTYTLTNGNYVVRSQYWDNGATADAGAVTWCDGTTGCTGAVSTANSLYGSTASDQMGSTGITVLTNGNYVVRSPNWDNSAIVNAGAATWCDGTIGCTGVVSAANSLVGSTGNDQIGKDITFLTDGDYVVVSTLWDNGAIVDAGAVTWCDGTIGCTGAVSTANSLYGSTAGDQVGSWVTFIANGNYVVGSQFWDSGATADAGAATWCSGTAGCIGAVSTANSLYGTTANDKVGGFLVGLANGNYVVDSTLWDNGATADVGAVTWCSGTIGCTGAVSTANSLYGSTANDYAGWGSIFGLANGNYVVLTPTWDNGGVANVGAATWCSGTTGCTGAVSTANSLYGSTANDYAGWGSVVNFVNGNYAVLSRWWDNGVAVDVGAITWGSGTAGVIGAVSSLNSIVGQAAWGSVTWAYATAGAETNTFLASFSSGMTNTGHVFVGYDDPNMTTFNRAQGQTITFSPDFLTRTLNTGTNVTLQASNDITVNSAITVNNVTGNGGVLTMQAGRSILVNANITTDNGNLSLTANETLANGVVDADRSAGAAAITMAAGTAINAGSGSVSMIMSSGAGVTNAQAGAITLANVTANTLTINTMNTVTQAAAGALTLTGLELLGSGGAYTLTNTGNAVTTLAGNTGSIDYRNNKSLVVGTVNATSGIVSTGNVTLYASGATSDLIISKSIYKDGISAAAYDLMADRSVIFNSSADIDYYFGGAADSNTITVTLNSDRDASNSGNIQLEAGSSITSYGGAITLGGGLNPATTAAVGTGSATQAEKTGIYLDNALLSAGAGNISLTGSGITSGVDSAYGIYAFNGTDMLTTSGNITLTGVGGFGSGGTNFGYNHGVYLYNTATSVSSATGAINITGTGNSTSLLSDSYGVYIQSALVSSTGTGAGAATIDITGTGGNGYNNCKGVNISGFGGVTAVTSVDGAITITGTGRGSKAFADGVDIGGSTISSTGSATIDITGYGSGDGNDASGITLWNGFISSVNGDVTLNGYGGGYAVATTFYNYGVCMVNASGIVSTGVANINITGTGGLASSANYGVLIQTLGTLISSVDGNINITGIGNGTGVDNYGVNMTYFADVTSSGLGNIIIAGTGAGTAAGVRTSQDNTIGGPSAKGNITLTADTISGTDAIDLTGAILQSTGNLYLQPLVASTTIGIAGGAGEFNLSTTDLNAIQNGFANIYIGRTDSTGLMTFGDGAGAGTGYTFKDNLTLRTPAGAGDITISDALATGSVTQVGTITLQAGDSITTNSSITTQGQAVTLNSDRDGSGAGNIVMNSGSSITSNGGAITLGGGLNPATTAAVGTGTATQAEKTGVYLNNATLNAGAGNITITGKGVAGTTDAYGIFLANVPTIQTTSGTITLVGTGGDGGTAFNSGIGTFLTIPVITSVDGDITLTGYGGAGTTTNNEGLYLIGISITSTGAANIILNGTGGSGTNFQMGMHLYGNTTIKSSSTGNIVLNGQGGTSATGSWNNGVRLVNGPKISSTGTGSITINGTGGGGSTGGSYGFDMDASVSVTTVSSVSGAIVINGTGGTGTPGSNYGVNLSGSLGSITSSSGSIAVNGTGGAPGTNNYGIYMWSGADIFSTGSATISLTGTGKGTGAGIMTNSGHTIGGPSATGNITLTADTISGTDSIDLTGATVQSTGNLYLQPLVANTDIGIAGGAGEFNLNTTDLNAIQNGFSNIYIGRTDSTGLMTFGDGVGAGTGYTFQDNLTLRNPGSGSLGMTITDSLSVGANNLTLNTTGTVTQTAAITAAGLEFLGTGGTYTLNNIGNSITTLAGNTGSVSYSQPGALAIGTVNTAGLTASDYVLIVLTGATSDITLNNGVTANGVNDALILASGRNFINNAGAAPLSAPNGRYLVYSADPASNTFGGFTSPGNYFNCSYGACTPAAGLGSRMVYSITPTLTVTADAISRVYGDVNPALTYQVTGLVTGDTIGSVFTGALSTTALQTSNVGAYPISQGALAAGLGYGVSFTGNNLTITAAPLTITANNASRVYGDANPAFTATYTGLKNGETAAVVSGLVLSTAAVPTSNVGNYAITAAGATATNYAITMNPGTLTVTQAPLSITANNASRVYGDANPALTATYTGLKNGETSAVVSGLVLSTAAVPTSNVGNYAITAAGATATNYAITMNPGTLTVTQAPLSITANNASRVYGDANPALTATYTSLKNGETSAVVSGLVLSTAAVPTSNVGNYAITAAGATATNYAITLTNGTLTVTAAPLTIIANNASRVYGDANPAFTATYTGLKNGETSAVVSGLVLSTTAVPTSNVGNYAITAAGAIAANYAITLVDGTLTVIASPVTPAQNPTALADILPPVAGFFAGLDDNVSTHGMSETVSGDLADSKSVFGKAPYVIERHKKKGSAGGECKSLRKYSYKKQIINRCSAVI